tara:strand:+ start:1599 stop:1790 length:192 start_codon:yes stop_codon:yes gene_type:complete
MNCQRCGCSVQEKPLERVSPPGTAGIWWCMDYIKEVEPELAKNILEDKPEVQKELEKLFYKYD